MIIIRIIKIARIAFAVILCFPLVLTALHMGLHACPFHFAHFEESEAIPVVYGLPTFDGYLKASSGKIILGGCIRGPVRAVCPYCKWPTRLRL